MLSGNCVIYKKSPCRPKVANDAYKESECQEGRCPGGRGVLAWTALKGSQTGPAHKPRVQSILCEGSRAAACALIPGAEDRCAGQDLTTHQCGLIFLFFFLREGGETCALVQEQCVSFGR